MPRSLLRDVYLLLGQEFRQPLFQLRQRHTRQRVSLQPAAPHPELEKRPQPRGVIVQRPAAETPLRLDHEIAQVARLQRVEPARPLPAGFEPPIKIP